ncbi:hypothetical protein BDW66DRAFT_97217 [Aspergillus desertorum]
MSSLYRSPAFDRCAMQTNFGMLTFTDEASLTKIRKNHRNEDHIAFFSFANLMQRVLRIFRLLRESPSVLDVPVTGYICRLSPGKIVKVE